jgi:hypothetical protein
MLVAACIARFSRTAAAYLRGKPISLAGEHHGRAGP